MNLKHLLSGYFTSCTVSILRNSLANEECYLLLLLFLFFWPHYCNKGIAKPVESYLPY